MEALPLGHRYRLSPIETRTSELLATLQDSAAAESDVQRAARLFFDTLSGSSEEQANAALAQIAPALLLPDVGRAAMAALICGALVELGCSVAPVTGPLDTRLRAMLEHCVRLAEACSARLPARVDEDEIIDDRFEDVRRELARTMPEENAAWHALEKFWQPALGIYLSSAEARADAQPLRVLASAIAPYHEGGYWLRQIWSVPDREPLLVLEPAKRRGIRAIMSGIADNFQLNVLLMDAFPRGMFSRRRVSSRVADVARGIGPQQTSEIITCSWNLYTWHAITADGHLPDANDYNGRATWIWNEGVPADIPMFENQRVILIGPAAYERSWQSQRVFDKLPAALEVEQVLSAQEVEQWLARMAAARA